MYLKINLLNLKLPGSSGTLKTAVSSGTSVLITAEEDGDSSVTSVLTTAKIKL